MDTTLSATEAVGEFMVDFTQTYIMEMVNAKIEGAIEEAIEEATPDVLAAEEEEEPGEEKALEDKAEGGAPLATGVVLVGYKHGYGPDRAYHRYYDLAVFAIKPQDSVIDKVTYRHRQLLNFATALKKSVPDLPAVVFPGKKYSKKTDEFYRERFQMMQTWFVTMSKTESVRMNEEWLKFFQLEFDADQADRLELFFSALESQCDKDSINWESAFKRAQRLGLDMFEVEMLKVVAIEKVISTATEKIKDSVNSSGATSYLPGSVKSRFISSLDGKMAAAIGTAVEKGWESAAPAFKEASDKLSSAMDSAVEPLKEMFAKVMDPLKELVNEKLKPKEDDGDEDEKEDPIDAGLQALTARRFPPISRALDGLLDGSLTGAAAASALRVDLKDLNYTHKYTPYVQYNCGDPDIVAFFSEIEKITEKHQRLTVALIDAVYVLARGMTRAFGPLLAYADEAKADFNVDNHQAKIKEALQIGGEKLAIDYFYLPSTLWRATFYCGQQSTKDVLRYARVTVNEIADCLGTVASAWQPTSKDDVMSTLVTALESALDSFVSERVFALVTLVRGSAISMISDLFNDAFGPAISTIADTLDSIVSALPPPLSDLKPGSIVESVISGLIEKIAEKSVRLWARKCERLLIDPDSAPEPWDAALASSFRVEPRIINSDDDLSKPQADPEGEGAPAETSSAKSS